MRRLKDTCWGGLGALLLPSLVRAEVADKQLLPWEPAPVLATWVMCGLCLALSRSRREHLWKVAGVLSVLWALFWGQNLLPGGPVGQMLDTELLSGDAAAFRGGFLVQALLPMLVTLIGLWRRRLRLRGS